MHRCTALSRFPRFAPNGPSWRQERLYGFISHITDGKTIEVWRSHETSR